MVEIINNWYMMNKYHSNTNSKYNTDNYTQTYIILYLENGVYMLSIANDNGNRAIRKKIVQN